MEMFKSNFRNTEALSASYSNFSISNIDSYSFMPPKYKNFKILFF